MNLLQVFAPNATCEYRAFVDEVNGLLLWKMLFYEYDLLYEHAQSLCGSLAHWLEQTQIRERV